MHLVSSARASASPISAVHSCRSSGSAMCAPSPVAMKVSSYIVPYRSDVPRYAAPSRCTIAACWRDVGARGATFAAAPEFAGVDPDADADRVALGPWRGKHLNQIHQIAVAVEEKEDALAAAVPAVVLEAAANAWTAQRRPPVVSWYQRDVASILSYMGERHEDEARCAGYRVDLLVPDPVGVDKGAFPGGVAVEVDGPSHFARNDAAVALGQTRLKRAQLRKLGFAVVSVPVAEWEYLETAEEKVEFLREGMQDAVRGR